MLTKKQLADFSNQLRTLRAHLDARVDSIRAEAAHGSGGENSGGLSNVPIHLGDLGSLEEGTAVSIGLAENEANMRQEIDEALERVEEGTYGTCEGCGAGIALPRLDAVPYARWCIRCAEENQQMPQ